MRNQRMTPLFLLLLVGSVLMVVNAALIASAGSPLSFTSSPVITRFSNWQDFKSLAVNSTMVTYLHKEPEQLITVEATVAVNVSSVIQQQILSFNGNFPGDSNTRHDPVLLKLWLANELSVDNETITGNRLISVESINKASFWGRFVSGMPGMVEGQLAYVWLIFSLLVLAFTMMIYLKPSRRRSLGLWIAIFSLLTFPAGGGFIIGALLCTAIGIAGMDWMKRFRETFFGRMLNIARLDSKVIKATAEDPSKMQSAVTTLVFVAILSSIGIGLYAFNVNQMYSQDALSNLRTSYNILVQGTIFSGIEVYIGILSSIMVNIIKWLILSLLVYVVGSKLLGFDFKFRNMATILAFVYVPEVIQVLTPTLFFNEPLLSQGIGIAFIPVTWSLLLFYVSRLWAFAILMIAVGALMDISRTKAVGVSLFVGTLYYLINYVLVYPQLKVPGLRIEFSNSMDTILIAATLVFLATLLLGIFKKEA